MRIAIAVCLLALVAGCRHTRLTVQLDGNQSLGDDVEKLLDMTDVPEHTVTIESGQVVVNFKGDLDVAQRMPLLEALDKIKGAGHWKGGPLLTMRLTETDPDVLKALGLGGRASPNFPVKLVVRKGRPALKVRKSGAESLIGYRGTTMCVFEVPLEEDLPVLTYKIDLLESSLKDSHLSAAARRVMTELVNAENATNPEAKTEVVALDPDLAPMTKDMSFFETGKMNVMIDVSEDAAPANILGTASHSEFAGCYHKILATDGAFYRDLLFPDISGRIKDYNFDQAF